LSKQIQISLLGLSVPTVTEAAKLVKLLIT